MKVVVHINCSAEKEKKNCIILEINMHQTGLWLIQLQVSQKILPKSTGNHTFRIERKRKWKGSMLKYMTLLSVRRKIFYIRLKLYLSKTVYNIIFKLTYKEVIPKKENAIKPFLVWVKSLKPSKIQFNNIIKYVPLWIIKQSSCPVGAVEYADCTSETLPTPKRKVSCLGMTLNHLMVRLHFHSDLEW